MMKVMVKVYDGCKYNADSKKVAEVTYEVESFRVYTASEEEITANGFDEFDEFNEYLELTLSDGETATFRNSHVDMFRW